jgi:hypothetical protein
MTTAYQKEYEAFECLSCHFKWRESRDSASFVSPEEHRKPSKNANLFLSTRHLSKVQKRLIILILGIVITITILIAPIIPTQHTVTKTMTRNLWFSSQEYGTNFGLYVPKIVNVTNTDSIGGTFTVTMKMWENDIVAGVVKPRLIDTSTQSSFISAGATHTFNLPSNWLIIEPMNSFTYSVSAPGRQVSYQETQTEYESILNLIENSLGK